MARQLTNKHIVDRDLSDPMPVIDPLTGVYQDTVEFNRLLPNSDLYWVDKCGHAPMMEHPEEFNRILENWLKERNL